MAPRLGFSSKARGWAGLFLLLALGSCLPAEGLSIGGATAGAAIPGAAAAAAHALALALLLGGPPPPPARAAEPPGNTGEEQYISDLRRSLKPATPGRPQIPFPTREAAKANADANLDPGAGIPVPGGADRRGAPQKTPPPDTLRALVSVDASIDRRRDRPYNAADVLVLQVWSGRPPEGASRGEASLLGGARIPIGAVVGGFPVDATLGPSNASGGRDEWGAALSSESLWLRASVCREGGGASSPSPGDPCPSGSERVLGGTGFSKWIGFAGAAEAPRGQPGIGVRAPASVLLTETKP